MNLLLLANFRLRYCCVYLLKLNINTIGVYIDFLPGSDAHCFDNPALYLEGSTMYTT